MAAVEPLNFARKDDIDEYEAGLAAYLAGRMPEERFTPFRLQMGVYGQRQDGVQMVRIKIPGGALNPEQLEVIGDCVERYAGRLDMPKYAHITTRQDIQAHFVDLRDTPAFLRSLAAAGLTTREACGNTVRNVTACFLAGVCPAEHADVAVHARAFAAHFLRHPLTQQFPRKFKVAFSGCDTDCAMSGMHDIGFIARARDGKQGFRVMAAGGLSSQPVSAIELEEFIEEKDLLLVAEALMRIHFKFSDRKRRARARMKYVMLKLGPEGFVTQYRREKTAIEKAHLADPGYPEANWRQPTGGFPCNGEAIVDQHDGKCAILLNIFRGDLTPAQCHAVAKAARLGNSSVLRTTPEQGLVIVGVSPDKVDAVVNSLHEDGLQTEYVRGIADIVACPGTESCRLGITSSRGLAAALEPLVAELRGDEALSGLRIKASGCQHSCGQHHIADLGFHGLAKKIAGQAVPHYQLHIGGSGRAGEAFAFATDPVPAKRATEAGLAVLEAYRSGRRDEESMHDWAQRLGKDGINQLLAPFAGEPGEVEGLIYDWDENQPFSTKDNKPGECAAAVIGMTDALLCEAKYELRVGNAHADAMFWSEAAANLKRAAVACGRAFLVGFGEAPEDDGQVLPLLARLAADDAEVQGHLATVTQALMGIDLAEPAPGVLALRDAVAAMVACAEKRFAPVPKEEAAAASKAAAATSESPLLDLSGVACPMNFVKTKLKLETLPLGGRLAVILDDGEPISNVPRSLEEQGQKVLEKERVSEAQWRILVEKAR